MSRFAAVAPPPHSAVALHPDPPHQAMAWIDPPSREQEMVVVLTTEAGMKQAERLAHAVLEAHLAACVGLAPITSLYRWQGSLERGQEVQLLMKSHPARLKELEALVHSLHSYDTPEWIWWPARASCGYGGWIQHCCET